MNIIELKENLEILKINKRMYSLNGELKMDCLILFHNYNKWEVFYLDERGERNDEQVFKSESEACLYIYKLFKDAKGIEVKFGIRT